MNKKAMLGNLIGGFIMIVIAFAMFPIITEAISNMTLEGNISMGGTIDGENLEGSWGGIMLTMVPLVFVITILIVVVGMTYTGLRSAGLIGGCEDDFDSRDLNGDGVVDENEEMISKLEEGDYGEEYIPPKKPEIKLPPTQAEEDLQRYKKRNRKLWKESNDESFEEQEKGSAGGFKESETESPESFKDKETFHKSKSVLEKKLKKSRFD